MTRAECIAVLDGLASGDAEHAHTVADEVLVNYLRESGAADLAEAWERAHDRVGFWYA